MIELKITGSAWAEILEQVGPITGPHMLETKPVELEALKPVEPEAIKAVFSPAVTTDVPAEPVVEMPKKPAKKATPKKTAVEAPRSDDSIEMDKVSTPEAKTQESAQNEAETRVYEKDEVRAKCLKLRDTQGIGQLKLVFTGLGKSKFDQFTPEEYPALVAAVNEKLGE